MPTEEKKRELNAMKSEREMGRVKRYFLRVLLECGP